MKRLLILSLLLTLLGLFTSCSKISNRYYYLNYPNESNYEYSKYLNIKPTSFMSPKDDNRALAKLRDISVSRSSYRDMEPDSTGKLREVYRKTERFEFLDRIKLTYKNKTYNLKKENLTYEYYDGELKSSTIGTPDIYYDLDDKDSYFILDIGRVKLKIYNYQTKETTEKIIKIPPLTFKMYMSIIRSQSALQQLDPNSKTNFIYLGWAENYKKELPLPYGERVKKPNK